MARRIEDDRVASTFRLTRAHHDWLRGTAYERGTSQQALVNEALNPLAAKYAAEREAARTARRSRSGS